eukprot:3221292-Rhodomonas_salina.2
MSHTVLALNIVCKCQPWPHAMHCVPAVDRSRGAHPPAPSGSSAGQCCRCPRPGVGPAHARASQTRKRQARHGSTRHLHGAPTDRVDLLDALGKIVGGVVGRCEHFEKRVERVADYPGLALLFYGAALLLRRRRRNEVVEQNLQTKQTTRIESTEHAGCGAQVGELTATTTWRRVQEMTTTNEKRKMMTDQSRSPSSSKPGKSSGHLSKAMSRNS